MALKDKIRVRTDTTANWTSANPVLALREISYDSTAKKFKIGDGVTAWVSLSYTSAGLDAVADQRFIANVSGGSAVPTAITPDQALTALSAKVKSLADLATPASTSLLAMNSSGAVVDGSSVVTRRNHISASVLEYGALGDGTTDDTAAINAAFAASTNVCFPKTSSYYKITAAITVPAGTRIWGGGEIHQATLMQNCFNLNDNCVVDGVIITCPSRSNGVSTTSGDNGISVVGKKNIKVVNCLFKNWICSGVYLQDSFYCSVSNNTFTGANWDLTNPGSSGVSSDILIYSGTAGGGHVITENICLSNNSQGILCSAIGFDTDTTISNNVCITRNTDGTEPAIGTGIGGVGYLNRRHGIVVSYGGSSSSGRMTVTGNVCRRTLVTGIYVACSITLQKGVTVVGNVCSQNGYATASDSTLAGGISINGGGSGIIVASNVIEDFQGVASTGAINVISNADSETLVTGNLVNNSVRNGIRVYGASHNVTVSHNHIVGSGDYDIGLELASGAKGIRILDNCCIRKNSSSQSLRYDQIGSGSLVVIRGNRFAGFSNSASLHVAIFLVHTNDIEVEISGNDIRRFQRAILINAGATSRLVSKIKVENNNIDDCTFGFSGTHTNGIIPAVQNNFSSSVTTKYQPDGDCAFVETVAINDGKLIVHGTAAPTGRSWVVGDRVINSNPSVGQPKSWVCTVPGTPGTWVSEGNL